MKYTHSSTTKISKKISIPVPQSGWEAAIRDAEEQIAALKSRQAALRGAIRIFKERLEQGEPFPVCGEPECVAR